MEITNENEMYNIVGKNIKKYRKLYGIENDDLTQRELAEKIKVSTSLISGLESKNINRGISIYNLYKISEVLKVPINKFFE